MTIQSIKKQNYGYYGFYQTFYLTDAFFFFITLHHGQSSRHDTKKNPQKNKTKELVKIFTEDSERFHPPLEERPLEITPETL